jgi:hypothetical protein
MHHVLKLEEIQLQIWSSINLEEPKGRSSLLNAVLTTHQWEESALNVLWQTIDDCPKLAQLWRLLGLKVTPNVRDLVGGTVCPAILTWSNSECETFSFFRTIHQKTITLASKHTPRELDQSI